MTNEELRNKLYNQRFIAGGDYNKEDPFVGIHFEDLVDIKQKIEDDVIKKAVDWLMDNANDYIINDKCISSERDWLKVKSELFDDLKEAMKGD